MDPMKTTYGFINWIGRLLFQAFVIALSNFWARWGDKRIVDCSRRPYNIGIRSSFAVTDVSEENNASIVRIEHESSIFTWRYSPPDRHRHLSLQCLLVNFHVILLQVT
jgi:hypothetical protein